MPSIIEIGLHL